MIPPDMRRASEQAQRGGAGLILTNAHVVRDARKVAIRPSDRREFKARVLGADITTDIAVLRIDARNLPAEIDGEPVQRSGDLSNRTTAQSGPVELG